MEKDARKYGVKVLGGGLEKKLTVNLPMSKTAAMQIEKVGGKVEKKNEEVNKSPGRKKTKESKVTNKKK